MRLRSTSELNSQSPATDAQLQTSRAGYESVLTVCAVANLNLESIDQIILGRLAELAVSV